LTATDAFKSQLLEAQNIPFLCQTKPEVLKHALNYASLILREHRHMFQFLSTVWKWTKTSLFLLAHEAATDYTERTERSLWRWG
jgi:hypothetical protein